MDHALNIQSTDVVPDVIFIARTFPNTRQLMLMCTTYNDQEVDTDMETWQTKTMSPSTKMQTWLSGFESLGIGTSRRISCRLLENVFRRRRVLALEANNVCNHAWRMER
jgi:hypothetical protein